jgi:hypothetical protein
MTSFRGARIRANPESRGFDHIWIPGSLQRAAHSADPLARPGMTESK